MPNSAQTQENRRNMQRKTYCVKRVTVKLVTGRSPSNHEYVSIVLSPVFIRHPGAKFSERTRLPSEKSISSHVPDGALLRLVAGPAEIAVLQWMCPS
jgi:hypothetical protein